MPKPNDDNRDPRDGYWHGPGRALKPAKSLPIRELLAYATAVKAHERVRPTKGKPYAFDNREVVGQEQETVALLALRKAVLRMP
jgi:hypothetical protein